VATTSSRAFQLLGQDCVVFRSPDGDVRAFLDRCPHRFVPLSLGAREDESLRCAYHGWVFDQDGVRVEIPALGLDATLRPEGET
jgi:vanillate O-demethylase monooxygenase subunit